jgi:asparagine synthase (glutamine-hydrolysing)
MCGIAGILHWGNKPDPSIITKMTDAIAHRGPDDSGALHLDNIDLGHRRLSIIDLSTDAKQPMCDIDKKYHIVFNGEIYNFQEIKDELFKLGYHFKTKSDTEVILNAYAQWGPACLSKFNGMFAIALWDVKQQTLFLARDRFGKKPLYYTHTPDNKLIFASELSAILTALPKKPETDPEAINCYLALGYILNPLSIYKDIYKLEPATYMLVSNQGQKKEKHCYWDYAEYFHRKTTHNEKQIIENIDHLLNEAVRLRLISDVPVGAFLSGGIDSSSIVQRIKQISAAPLHTFSIGFEEKSYSELDEANAMAALLKTDHHGQIVSSKNIRQLVEQSIDAFDEPFADNSLIPMMEVSKLAAQNIKVVLSGDGADELFAGYITYKADKYYRYSTIIPKFLKQFAYNLVKEKNVHSSQKINFSYKLRQFLNGSLKSYEEAHYSWRLFFSPEERLKIMGNEYKDLIYDTDPYKRFKTHFDKTKGLHWLDRSLHADGMTWLTDDILVKVDRTTMRNGLEARAPYLDKNLAEYAASIPADLKLKGLTTKYILKKTLESSLPHETLYKKKSGFNAPIGKWLGLTEGDEFRSFNKFVYDRKLNYAAKTK